MPRCGRRATSPPQPACWGSIRSPWRSRSLPGSPRTPAGAPGATRPRPAGAAGAAAVPPAVPERDRRRAARAAAAERRVEVKAAMIALLAGLSACAKAQPAPPYQKIPVEHRDIVVSATASGVIQPILTLSVKSKASGEILEEPVQTGDEVKQGQLLARIDPRIPQSNLTQAEANLGVAQAQLETATAQLKRSEALFQSQSITQAGLDSARLASATAQAAVATAQANLQTAKDAMQDTRSEEHTSELQSRQYL